MDVRGYSYGFIDTSLGVEIKGRRTGNTTRVIDNAIQLLFKGHAIWVKDNYYDGSTRLDVRIFERLLKRLLSEHDITPDQMEMCDKRKQIMKL
jgi:hypothetical protein